MSDMNAQTFNFAPKLPQLKTFKSSNVVAGKTGRASALKFLRAKAATAFSAS